MRGALILAILLLLVPAHAQRPTDLERIRTDITRLKLRLDEVRRQAQSAERELEEVDLELGIRTNELELAAAAETRLAAEQLTTEQQIAALVPRIAQQKTDLRKRLVALYRLGGLSYLRMLLALDGDRNPIEAMSMLSYLVSRDSRLVTRFQTTQKQLAARQVELVDRRDQLRRTRLVVEERRRAVATAVAQKQAVLARLRVEESGAAQQLAALEEKARRLQRLVDTLSQKQAGAAPVTDIRSVQGALAWPVEGKVIERFGRQRNPKFATYTVNNGLKIEAAPGTQVRAVFQGTVLFSQWFKGYGNLIILDHGNRVFSLYGNLKQSGVAVGDKIATGQVLAGVGESEDAADGVAAGHLYFEVRHDNHPEDPQKWLR
ncbi:MAG TPA: peptidoglycan DD-metalloendopeptidase family protein [Thermoanaerobaculia bacterium]|jgi:septal ring factor EnvC (AmiA/AmiB activator)|nr:peptidoglycan DD-metalloendopeptidase family protein [Thermoanaerobaculia bacterium]